MGGTVFLLQFRLIANFTPSEKIKYEKDMTTERDIRNQIRFAEKKGIQEGMEKGMKAGVEQERLTIAKQMLAKGYAQSDVAEITGLKPEAIAVL